VIKPNAIVLFHGKRRKLEQVLKEYVKARLAPYKYPRWIEFRNDLVRMIALKSIEERLSSRFNEE